MNDTCIFCDANEESLVLKTEDGIVVLDDPVCPGHVLVGSRTHHEGLADLDAVDAAAMMKLANRVSKIILEETGAQKVYVAAIGDKDKHFHVHLVPKHEGDPNLGPYIFGAKGWIGFMETPVDRSAVASISEAIQRSSN